MKKVLALSRFPGFVFLGATISELGYLYTTPRFLARLSVNFA